MKKDCPTCGHRLKQLTKEEAKKVAPGRYEDEEIYWCAFCRDYVYEEDFLYDTTE